ncbi:MAG: hypothetical protein JST87_19375 [Bacteroidetes bacterium]|nr:hypothetical protein [Bacteroidota bacterium]
MPKTTGYYFMDCFSGVCLFLPLLPAIILFIKKGYQKEATNFLMILCFISFIKGMLLVIPGITTNIAVTIKNIFMFLELVIILFMFKIFFSAKLNYAFTIFSVIFFSSIITYYLLNGLNHERILFNQMQNGIIIFVSVFALIQILKTENLFVLQNPLFWAATGTVFYFSISLLVGAVNDSSGSKDSLIILNIADLVRYSLYCIAAFFYRNITNEEKESYRD